MVKVKMEKNIDLALLKMFMFYYPLNKLGFKHLK